MKFTIIALLILANGVFAMSEIALVSTRKSKLAAEAKKGSKTAQDAINLAGNPDKFFSTVQIGITLIGILTGLYSGDVLSADLARFFESLAFPKAYSLFTAQAVILLTATYFTLIFGELVPKRIGLAAPERIAKIIAKPMLIISKLASPFVFILSKSTSFVLKLLRIDSKNSRITEEEIKMMVAEGAVSGEVQKIEQNIVERVFSLGDRFVGAIMTPRNEIAKIDISLSNAEINELVKANPHTVYPVSDGTLDKLLGVVSLEDMFGKLTDANFEIKSIFLPLVYFHENTKVYKALEDLRTKRSKYGLVCDEFGVITGIITLNDIIDAVLGNMPEAGEELEIVERSDGTYLVDGQCSMHDFLVFFETQETPDSSYNTVAGLMLAKLGRIPTTGEKIEWKNFTLEVIDMDNARIDKILVSKKSISEI